MKNKPPAQPVNWYERYLTTTQTSLLWVCQAGTGHSCTWLYTCTWRPYCPWITEVLYFLEFSDWSVPKCLLDLSVPQNLSKEYTLTCMMTTIRSKGSMGRSGEESLRGVRNGYREDNNWASKIWRKRGSNTRTLRRTRMMMNLRKNILGSLIR